MKFKIGLCSILLAWLNTFADQDKDNFHSFKTLFVQATIANHDVIYGKSIDPRIGLLFSFPVYYNFIHLDLSTELSPRPFLTHDYSSSLYKYKGINSDSISYFQKEWVSNQKGIESVLSIYPTIYLKHLFIGIGVTIDIEYMTSNYRYIRINPSNQDTTFKSSNLRDGTFLFDQNYPAIKLGWRFSNFSIFAFFQQEHTGLSYIQKIWTKPSRNKNLRTSIYD